MSARLHASGATCAYDTSDYSLELAISELIYDTSDESLEVPSNYPTNRILKLENIRIFSLYITVNPEAFLKDYRSM
jgi:hypothetical protein